MTIFYVALGGAIGATLRYLTFLVVAFPFGTAVVNVVGSFLMGLGFVWIAEKGFDRAAIFTLTGVLGGFTTFSAFSLDAVRLYERGDPGLAVLYVFATVALSILGLVVGVMVARVLA